MRYPQEILDLLTLEGFNERFEELAAVLKQEEAYDKVEEEYIKYYSIRKYANFASFKRARGHYLSSRKERKG